MIIAHRGRTQESYGDNTKEGLLHALSIPEIDGVELDVRKTKDNHLVLIHDPMIPLTEGIGLIKYMTLQELQQYEFGTSIHPSKISTLESFFSQVKTDKMIMIELKDSTVLPQLVPLVKKYAHLNLYICSFDATFVKEIKAKHRDWKVGVIMGNFINHNVDFNFFDFVSIAYQSVLEIHTKIPKFAWTVNQPKLISNFSPEIGIITDHYERFKNTHHSQ